MAWVNLSKNLIAGAWLYDQSAFAVRPDCFSAFDKCDLLTINFIYAIYP